MSGIYIKGRKLPNSCDDCWVSDCPNDEHIDGYQMMDRPYYCPLIPVPDHGRLVDADALMEHLGDVEYKGAIKRVLVQVPTIIPADKEERT